MYRSQWRTLLARLSPGRADSASWHYTLAQESTSALQGRPPPVFQNTPTTLLRQPKAPSLQSPRSHQSQGGSSLYPLLDCDDIITILVSEQKTFTHPAHPTIMAFYSAQSLFKKQDFLSDWEGTGHVTEHVTETALDTWLNTWPRGHWTCDWTRDRDTELSEQRL